MTGQRHPHEMTCQAPRRTPHARSDAVHGIRLGAAERPIRPTRRLLEDLNDRAPGRIAGWCFRCGVASEFEYVDDLEAAS